MRRTALIVYGPAALLLLADARRALSQTPTPDNYEHFLPDPPAIVAQTEASARFHLFGNAADPAYVDAAPRDGVDDARARRLLELGERFSPILRRNTYSVPQFFEAALGERVLMHVEAWLDGKKVSSEVLDLGPPVEPPSYGPVTPREAALATVEEGTPLAAARIPTPPAPDDEKLRALLLAREPDRLHAHVAQPKSSVDTILYIDVPGDDEFSWRPSHEEDRAKETRIYVHPFINETSGTQAERRFEFLLQYWFYYPYNDGANNHEGDWEHITVSVTTHERAARDRDLAPAARGLLSAAEIEAILGSAGSAATPADLLTIRNVAYYFHNYVMVVDYLGIAAGETMWRRAEANDGSIRIWEDKRYMDRSIRGRMALAGGRLATHPIGYIGGNNKGWDEVMQLVPRFYKSYNRDSHGTYPFPGVWREVGPVEATEKIHGEPVPDVHRNGSGEPDLTRPWWELIEDERYLEYRADDMILLPDWERLEPLVLEDPVVRREWAWFILPVHMGFPATRSPGAGALPHVDLGNVAPMSPVRNSAWNRPGATGTYVEYEPTVLRVAAAPISPASGLQSGWGIFNIPIAIASLLPGFNVAYTQLLPWITGAMHVMGQPPAKTFYLGELPNRFTSIGAGGFHQFGGQDFARLLPGTENPVVADFFSERAEQGPVMGDWQRTPEWGSRAWFNLYYGSRLSMENSFAYSVARVYYPVWSGTGARLGEVSGRLYTRELTGGITYRLFPMPTDVVRFYGRVGYGWTSTSVRGVNVNGIDVPNAAVDAGYLPDLLPSLSWWPNTTYGGLGVEFFSPPSQWLFKRLGYGVRLEATGLAHRLDAPWECSECHVTAERGDVAMTVIFGW